MEKDHKEPQKKGDRRYELPENHSIKARVPKVVERSRSNQKDLHHKEALLNEAPSAAGSSEAGL